MSNISKYINFSIKVLKANFKKLRYPYKIFLVVTKSCGSKCANCHIWKETPVNEMTLDEYDRLSKSLGAHLSWLNISGGEPTDREDLIDIIKIFIKNCPNLLIVNFTTNGLNEKALMNVAEFLAKTNIAVVGINVSVDGPLNTHNKLRGLPNGFQQAISSLKQLRKIKKIKIHASMTLFNSNMHLIKETYESIKQYIPDFKKFELHLNQAFHSNHYYNNAKFSESSNYLSTQDIPSLYRVFYSPMEILKYIYIKKLLNFQKTKITPISCSSMTSNVYISEHGDLFTCTIWNKKIGSLRESNYDLSLLMKSEESLKIKSQINKKMCINCWSPCEAFPSILDNIGEVIK